jgi:hypothetical protein
MFDYILANVPHTGSIFTIKLLEVAGHVHSKNYMHWHWRVNSLALPQAPRILMTARDPYLSAIRTLTDNDPFDDICARWYSFIECKDFIDQYFVLDIGCREADRLEHVRNALDFCGITMTDKVVDYVAAWKPENTSESLAKQEYLETGKLPDGYDWSRLDDAVAWYKSLPSNDYV